MVTKIEIGDTIEVLGHLFICTNMETEMNKPAKVTFKQPIELMTRTEIEQWTSE